MAPMDLAIGIGDACVVEADRVQEYGHVISIDGETQATPEGMPRVCISSSATNPV